MVAVSGEFKHEESDVLDTEFQFQPLNSALGLEENIRQKREAIPGGKNKNNKKKKNSGKNNRKKKNKRPRKSRKNTQRKNNRKSQKNGGNSAKNKTNGKTKKNKGNNARNKTNSKTKKNKGNNARNKKKQRRRRKNTGRKKNKDAKKSKKGVKRNKNKKSRKKKKQGKSQNRKSSKGRNRKNKKSTKSKKKGSKNIKNKRSKKNNTKNNRAQNKTNKKSKKSKINRRKKSYKKRKGFPRNNRQATINLTCLRDAVTFTKFLKDNVINFLRRNTRLKRQNNVTTKKASKKGEFKEPAARLIQAGGGDRSNLSCGGSTKSAGATKMKTAIETLDACNAAIDKACKPPTSSNESSALKTCGKQAVDFNTTVTKCIKMATEGQDACSCFQAPEVAKDQKALRNCKGTSQANAAAKQRTKCLKEVQKCKTAASTAGILQYACLFTADELLKGLKQLDSNQKAIKAFLDKIKKLTGLSPNLPGAPSNKTLSGRHKEARSVEAENEDEEARNRGKRQEVSCSSVVATITTCTTTITNTPASIKVETSCKSPTFTISACSTDDNTNIQKALDALLEADTIIIAFMMSIKSELKETTGSTPSPDAITATAKAAVRSRSLLRKMIMEKMQIRN